MKKVLLIIFLSILVLAFGFAAIGAYGDITFTKKEKAHECTSICEVCGKCTSDCADAVCAEKCEGHEGETPVEPAEGNDENGDVVTGGEGNGETITDPAVDETTGDPSETVPETEGEDHDEPVATTEEVEGGDNGEGDNGGEAVPQEPAGDVEGEGDVDATKPTEEEVPAERITLGRAILRMLGLEEYADTHVWIVYFAKYGSLAGFVLSAFFLGLVIGRPFGRNTSGGKVKRSNRRQRKAKKVANVPENHAARPNRLQF